jgi:ABC-type polysaccharide/polyol phosphate export permease
MFQIFKEHKGFSKQIFLLSKSELKKTYKGAAIGPLWALVKPAFTIFVYWFAFSVGIRGGSEVAVDGVGNFGRFIFMVVGFTAWFFMSESITLGSKSIRQNSQYVTKVAFPVSTIMTFTQLARLYVHLFLAAIMYVIVVFNPQGGVSWYNLQFFFYCPLMFAFFTVLAWSTAPMAAFSRDFENAVTAFMSGVFWLSGIFYNSYDMPLPILNKIMLFNPINFFANGYRNTFLYKKAFWENEIELYIFLAEFVLIFILGIWNYNRLRKRIPDVL